MNHEHKETHIEHKERKHIDMKTKHTKTTTSLGHSPPQPSAPGHLAS